MIRVEVNVDTEILDKIRSTAAQSPKLMENAYRNATRRLRRKMLDELQKEPGAVKRPIRWKSARQRRAYFATDGFGSGIPYVRSGGLLAAWKVDVERLGISGAGVFVVRNRTPAARFVQGDDQQPFHRDTGWPHAPAITAKYRAESEKILVDTWLTVADPFAGVRP